MKAAGFTLTPVRDPHLCCGSAGTYSILQRELAVRLRSVKLATLQDAAPQLIATANIGCLQHLAAAAAVPVKHWIELIDEAEQPCNVTSLSPNQSSRAPAGSMSSPRPPVPARPRS